MGNRSSSHYPPPPHWMHQRTSYSTSASPYPEAKRPIGPGAFAEPYMPNLQSSNSNGRKQQMRRSVISLNATDGFRPDPMMRGSRISLNQMDFEFAAGPHGPPRLIIPPDAKTLKKLEKMEKKHQKLLKKLGARGIPFPPPQMMPPPPMFTRTMSFDDLNRAHHNHPPSLDPDFANNGVRMRQREQQQDWRQAPRERREIHSQFIKQQHQHQQNQHNFSSNSTRRTGGSVASSSPMTSSEEGGHSTDPWNNSSVSSGRERRHNIMSPPMYSSTPHGNPVQPITKTIEVKVERSEKIEQQTKVADEKNNNTSQPMIHQIHNGNMYAQPIIRGQPSYGSRTSSVTNSLLKCDQSEIDFSWVNDEEDKLNREDSKLPEFYFGMDPPQVHEEESKENSNSAKRRSNVLEKTAAFEVEARRPDRKEPSFLSRSSQHLPQPDYSPLQVHTSGGPAERRIYRLQNQTSKTTTTQDDRRYRSSIAF